MEKAKIGLEIHGYLTTEEKLFCRCSASYKGVEITPNTNICPVCTGQPGSKPMLPNEEAMKKVIAIGLMLGCRINDKCVWQRKHYDWPDLPKGYQNTISGAYAMPVAEKGKFLGIGITEAHLEEDPAQWNPDTGLVDYNRCGVPLIEIVTDPDFKDSKQVIEWLNSLLLTLSYIQAVNPDAGIKADVNVSVKVDDKQGERVEIKNLNSLQSIQEAIAHEIKRQTDVLKEGGRVSRETRTYSASEGRTISMRSKEGAADYRFIPDPDLPVIDLGKKLVEEIKRSIPELPHIKVERFVKQYKLDGYTANVLTANIDIADFFEKIISKIKNAKLVSTWVTVELLRVLNWNKKSIREVKINPDHFIKLLELIEQKKITELAAKKMLNDFIPKSFDPSEKLKGSEKIEDKAEIEKLCKEAISKNPDAVESYKAGEEKSLNFLIGQVVMLSQRRADSRIAREIMMKLLKKR